MPITSSTSKLGRQTRALRHSFASHHLAKFTDAARLALELGHTNQELLFRHAEVWLLLFYGIQESCDDKRMAGAFPGLDAQTVATNEQQIRQAATAKLNPTPYFITRALRGPETSTGLASDKAIIVVFVPQGVDAPYIPGSIFRFGTVASQFGQMP